MRPGGAAEKNPGGFFSDSKHWATLLLLRRGAGRSGEGEAAEEGRPGRCGAVHARLMLAGRDGIAAAGRGGAGLGGGEAGGCRQTWAWAWPGGLAGWGVPGLQKASRSSSAGGIPILSTAAAFYFKGFIA